MTWKEIVSHVKARNIVVNAGAIVEERARRAEIERLDSLVDEIERLRATPTEGAATRLRRNLAARRSR